MNLIKTTFYSFLSLFTFCSVFAQPVTWDASTPYSTGALVIVGTSTYVATKDVPANNTPPNPTYWDSLEDTASSLSISAEELAKLPTTAVSDLLATLPGAAPDANSTSGAIQIFSLSTRAGVYDSSIAASLNMGGTTDPKLVMCRVKGPSMNFSGAKLADPNFDLKHRKSGVWTQVAKTSTFGIYSDESSDYTNSTTSYTDRHTGNNLEPFVVYSFLPDVYSCLVGSDSGTGNAIVEIYSLDDTTSSYFNSLSTRGYVSSVEMAGSLRLVGTGKKKIMFRVKGPSMNFSGAKLSDPKLTILTKTSDGTWVDVVKSSSFGSYTYQNSNFTNITSSYTDRHTGNNLEPMVVFELEEGTYSCLVGSDNGGSGNAIIEIYSVD